jgi:choloylglycine hydrolase
MLFTNASGLAKKALMLPPETPAEWTSHFGSVTFAQVGKEFPACGMNDAGLVVEQTTLWNTVYPDRDERPAVKELQWIQFMLDTCSSVAEVIEATRRIRVAQEMARLQYFVADRNGNTALISYIVGNEDIRMCESLPYPIIANDMYDTSVDFLHIHEGFGGKRRIDDTSEESLDRFARVARTLAGNAKNEAPRPESGFAVLDSVTTTSTQWKIVYEPASLKIHYSTRANAAIRTIDLANLTLTDPEKTRCRNIEEPGTEPLIRYSTELNRRLVDAFFAASPLSGKKPLAVKLVAALAEYPACFLHES